MRWARRRAFWRMRSSANATSARLSRRRCWRRRRLSSGRLSNTRTPLSRCGCGYRKQRRNGRWLSSSATGASKSAHESRASSKNSTKNRATKRSWTRSGCAKRLRGSRWHSLQRRRKRRTLLPRWRRWGRRRRIGRGWWLRGTLPRLFMTPSHSGWTTYRWSSARQGCSPRQRSSTLTAALSPTSSYLTSTGTRLGQLRSSSSSAPSSAWNLRRHRPWRREHAH
mmetsp:Transcript_14719/g.32966  ORF Transcript_14719/g.32966 Transcript_14719/m.32966 type:complete len:224 (+) Transcript_14719:414-1085(+)